MKYGKGKKDHDDYLGFGQGNAQILWNSYEQAMFTL